MNHLLARTGILLAGVACGHAHADVQDEQIQSLESRIAQLEAARADALPDSTGAPDGLKINGFISAGTGFADVPVLDYDNGLREVWSHKADAKFGLRVEGRVNEKTSAVTQLVAQGTGEFKVGADWAYVAYAPGPADQFRAGRLRYPLFALSEYLGVGAAYPWAKPPSEVYLNFMPPNFDGISWQHQVNAGDWSHALQAYWGSSGFDVAGGRFTLEDGAGLSWLAARENWQFSATYSQATSSFHNPFVDGLAQVGLLNPVHEDYGWFSGLGFQYDNGKVLLTGEATEIHVHGYFPDTAQQFLTLGYQLGKVMPHLTWSSSRILDAEDRPDLPGLPALCPAADPNPAAAFCLAIMPNTASAPPPVTVGVPFPVDSLSRAMNNVQDSVTLGVRYDVMENVDLKIDWTRVVDTHGTFGLFSPPDGNVFYAARPGNNIDVFRVVVDATF